MAALLKRDKAVDTAIAMAKLTQALQMFPHQRICQLIVNATGTDPFYIDDTRLSELLDKYMRENRGH